MLVLHIPCIFISVDHWKVLFQRYQANDTRYQSDSCIINYPYISTYITQQYIANQLWLNLMTTANKTDWYYHSVAWLHLSLADSCNTHSTTYIHQTDAYLTYLQIPVIWYLSILGNFEISVTKHVVGKFFSCFYQLNSPKFLKPSNVYNYTRNGIFGELWKSSVSLAPSSPTTIKFGWRYHYISVWWVTDYFPRSVSFRK